MLAEQRMLFHYFSCALCLNSKCLHLITSRLILKNFWRKDDYKFQHSQYKKTCIAPLLFKKQTCNSFETILGDQNICKLLKDVDLSKYWNRINKIGDCGEELNSRQQSKTKLLFLLALWNLIILYFSF